MTGFVRKGNLGSFLPLRYAPDCDCSLPNELNPHRWQWTTNQMLTNCLFGCKHTTQIFQHYFEKGKWGGNFIDFNSLEALRMAASLDKHKLLRKFRQVQKKIQILMLLVQWCCFLFLLCSCHHQTKKKKRKINSRYLEPTRPEEVTGVLFLATANSSSSKFLSPDGKASSSLCCCVYIKQ